MVLMIVQTNLMKKDVSLNAEVVASTIFNVKTVKAIFIMIIQAGLVKISMA
jgi:hypothetical protein